MGADFIFQNIPIEIGKEEEVKKKLLEAVDKFSIPELSDNTKQQVLNSIKEKNSEEFKQFCEFWEEGLNKEIIDDVPVFDEDDEIEFKSEESVAEGYKIKEEKARFFMRKVIEEFFECIEGNREVGSFRFKGFEIYLTGGMSWGDNPTDALNIFNKFINLPDKILNDAGVKWE